MFALGLFTLANEQRVRSKGHDRRKPTLLKLRLNHSVFLRQWLPLYTDAQSRDPSKKQTTNLYGAIVLLKPAFEDQFNWFKSRNRFCQDVYLLQIKHVVFMKRLLTLSKTSCFCLPKVFWEDVSSGKQWYDPMKMLHFYPLQPCLPIQH